MTKMQSMEFAEWLGTWEHWDQELFQVQGATKDGVVGRFIAEGRLVGPTIRFSWGEFRLVDRVCGRKCPVWKKRASMPEGEEFKP